MKTYIITSIAALCLTLDSLAATNERTDTIIKVDSPSSLVITETSDGINLSIKENYSSNTSAVMIADYSGDKTISIDQSTHFFQGFTSGGCGIGLKTNSHCEVISGGLNIGLVNSMGQPSDMNMKWAKSFEIGWLNAVAIRYRYRSISFSLGLGFDWRNYNTTNSNYYMLPDKETGIALTPYPGDVTPGNSRIKIFSLGFPLLYTQKIPGTPLAITAGGILNLNTHASLKTCYKTQLNNIIEEYSQNIKHRKISADIYGAIRLYYGMGVYVRYSPQSVLEGPTVPKFNPFSIGISLLM